MCWRPIFCFSLSRFAVDGELTQFLVLRTSPSASSSLRLRPRPSPPRIAATPPRRPCWPPSSSSHLGPFVSGPEAWLLTRGLSRDVEILKQNWSTNSVRCDLFLQFSPYCRVLSIFKLSSSIIDNFSPSCWLFACHCWSCFWTPKSFNYVNKFFFLIFFSGDGYNIEFPDLTAIKIWDTKQRSTTDWTNQVSRSNEPRHWIRLVFHP